MLYKFAKEEKQHYKKKNAGATYNYSVAGSFQNRELLFERCNKQ